MHIPENYLSPATCGVMTAAMIPVWTKSLRAVERVIPREKLPMVGVGAAFSFLAMMLNVPMVGGTTGHAVGGTLLAILFGPEAACLAVSIALLIQALFFGDGGLLAFGANCFNMAFVLPFIGYGVYQLIRTRWKSPRGQIGAAAIGSYVGINGAALCAAIEFGIQPLLFTNSQGQALYCPYPLKISVPAMMAGHLTVFGFAELIFTVAVIIYLKKAAPEMFAMEDKGLAESGISKGVKSLLLGLLALTPLGLLATGTAWGEWGSEEIAGVVSKGKVLGYTPAGIKNGGSLSVFFPDYSISGLPAWIGYLISGVIGSALLVILFKLLGSRGRKKNRG